MSDASSDTKPGHDGSAGTSDTTTSAAVQYELSRTREEKPAYLLIGNKEDGTKYEERSAVRVIIEDKETARILILHLNKGSYYKLPGGGIDEGEIHLEAIHREVKEETGFSYCYKSTLCDSSGPTELTELEQAEGLTSAWVSVGDAKKMMGEARPTNDLGKSIQKRDGFFLEKAF